MFLTRRSTQAEYFDAERPVPQLVEFFQALNRMNRFFRFAEPFQRLIPLVLGPEPCRDVTLLDLGAGDGTLGEVLEQWARGRGWNWQVTSLDLNPAALQLGRGARRVAGSALELPFADGSYDVVLSSQMTHHLEDAQVTRHLREAWRVARRGVVISDLHRNPALLGTIWLACRFLRSGEHFRRDALLSVRKAWRKQELVGLANQAAIPEVKSELYFWARVNLWAEKSA